MICDRDVGVDSQYCSICWHLDKPSEVYLIEGNKILCPPEGDAWFFWAFFELDTIDLLVTVKIKLEIEFFTWIHHISAFCHIVQYRDSGGHFKSFSQKWKKNQTLKNHCRKCLGCRIHSLRTRSLLVLAVIFFF